MRLAKRVSCSVYVCVDLFNPKVWEQSHDKVVPYYLIKPETWCQNGLFAQPAQGYTYTVNTNLNILVPTASCPIKEPNRSENIEAKSVTFTVGWVGMLVFRYFLCHYCLYPTNCCICVCLEWAGSAWFFPNPHRVHHTGCMHVSTCLRRYE